LERGRWHVDNCDIENFVHSLLDQGASVRPVDDHEPGIDQVSSAQPRATILGAALHCEDFNTLLAFLPKERIFMLDKVWSEPFEGYIHDVTALHIVSGL
jgi:hypothetical protein